MSLTRSTYPGGSEHDRTFFNVCRPSWYFSQAALWLSPCTSTCWRISFLFAMSHRADAPSFDFIELIACALLSSSKFYPGVHYRFQPSLASPGKMDACGEA